MLDKIYILGVGDVEHSTEIYTEHFSTAEDMINAVMSEREENRAIAIIGSPLFAEDLKNIAVNKMHGV